MTTEASAFEIRELSGDKRVVTLVGRALPFRPFSLRTSQRVEITDYPGNPESTSTVLGAKEKPTTVSGRWSDKFFDVLGVTTAEDLAVEQSQQTIYSMSLDGAERTERTPAANRRVARAENGQAPFSLNNQPVPTVELACKIMDSICREGQLIEVTWFVEKRVGHLADFEKRWFNTHDAEWTMDFTWISRGETPGAVVFISDTSTSGAFSTIQNHMAKLDSIGTGDLSLDGRFIDRITGFINGISTLVTDMEDQVAQLADQVMSPVRAVRGLVSTLTSLGDELDLMFDYLQSTVAGELAGGAAAETQTYSEKLSYEMWRRELEAWDREFARLAAEQKRALQEQLDSELMGTYTARMGQDLRDVSKQFYNTPHEWRRIMLFNNLTSAELSVGQLVKVPKINPINSSTEGEV
jgi:hypothetical protein